VGITLRSPKLPRDCKTIRRTIKFIVRQGIYKRFDFGLGSAHPQTGGRLPPRGLVRILQLFRDPGHGGAAAEFTIGESRHLADLGFRIRKQLLELGKSRFQAP
jgi:hypothetical protein